MNPQDDLIRQELEAVLSSPVFHGSRRCQDFLRYVVEKALAQHQENLKERVVGMELFGRAPDYNTASDAIVRVTANEVRKRLSLYNGAANRDRKVEITLPAGSYLPEFRSEPHGPLKPPHQPTRFRRAPFVAVVCGAVLLLAVIVVAGGSRRSALDSFWAPVLDAEQPVLICLGGADVYAIAPRVKELFTASPPGGAPGLISLSSVEISSVSHRYIDVGSAHAVGHLAGFFAKRGKPSKIKVSNEVSFADLRDHPSVLLGAFNNPWTLEMTGNLRFVFDPERLAIRDKGATERFWTLIRAQAGEQSSEDYGLISRVVDLFRLSLKWKPSVFR